MKDNKGQRAKYNYVQPMADLQKDADQRGQIEGISKATSEATTTDCGSQFRPTIAYKSVDTPTFSQLIITTAFDKTTFPWYQCCSLVATGC